MTNEEQIEMFQIMRAIAHHVGRLRVEVNELTLAMVRSGTTVVKDGRKQSVASLTKELDGRTANINEWMGVLERHITNRGAEPWETKKP